jgi:hypothetical protein
MRSLTGNSRVGRVAAALVLFALASVVVVSILVLGWAAQRGYDISDEGFYLYAAEPANGANTANGLWGMYTGLLYRLTGFSLVVMRVVGIALLVCCASWFSGRVSRLIAGLVDRPLTTTNHVAVLISTVGAALLYYGLGILTPSYNLLALCSILVALGGAFGIVAGPITRMSGVWSAVAVSAGSFFAFWCRSVAGVGVWLVCIALILGVSLHRSERAMRLQLVCIALAALGVLGAAHSIFLMTPGTTVSAMARARDFNFVGDFSKPLGTLLGESLRGVLDIPRAVVVTAGVTPVLGLLPALAVGMPAHRRSLAVAALASGSVVLTGISLAANGGFNGGLTSYATVTPAVLAIALTAGLSWTAAAWVRRRVDLADGLPSRPRAAVGALVVILLMCQCLYAFTSNNGLIGQTSGASVLGLLAAELLLIAAVGRDRSGFAIFALAVVSPIAFYASASTAINHPYRGDGSLARANTKATINVHGSQVLLTRAQAQYFRDLVGPATDAGFKAGTPLIDLTPFSPGASVALGAAAPNTLLFGYTSTTARWALSQQDLGRWRAAWVLIAHGRDGKSIPPEGVLAVLGRSFPADYVLVTTAVWPYDDEHQELWRPRDD